MPGNVDERVVEMRIDNKQFESGAKTTISTLEKLERALHLKSDSKALDDMARSVSNFDASPMASSIDKVGEHFNALEIAGKRVIENLTDGVYNFAAKTVKDLVIEQPRQGWNKYETKAEAVQSIMAATRDMVTGINELDENGIAISFATQEDQMEKVNELLEQMNWFTDETSYNFNDMATNVGKFLAAGTGLEDTFTAIMGIASWGGSAGAKPQEVSRAMYNISQAMSSGSMKAIDWKSIENAGMATLEFKQNALDAAEAMEKIRKVGNNAGYIEEEADAIIKYTAALNTAEEDLQDKDLFDAKSFREGLNTGWFDTEVMMEVFKRYGEFQDKLYDATEATGLEATDVLQLVDKIRDGNKEINWEKYAHDASMAADEFKEVIQTVSDVTWEFSENGFRMGQEAKTWTDMIEATKDAVSSEWMKTFQYIFGDYLEAKEFWTEMTGEFWEIFAAGGALRNEILDSWYSSGGRMALFGLDEKNLGAFWNIINSIKTVITPVHDALYETFGFDTEDGIKAVGERLAELTKRFQELTKNFGLSKEAQNGLKNIFSTIFSGAKSVMKVSGGVIAILGKFVWAIGEVIDAVLSFASGDVTLDSVIKRIQQAFRSVTPSSEDLEKALGRIYIYALRIWDVLSGIPKSLQKIRDFIKDPEHYMGVLSDIERTIADLATRFPLIQKGIEYFSIGIDAISRKAKELLKKVPAINFSAESIGKMFESLKNSIKGISVPNTEGLLNNIKTFFDEVLTIIVGDPDAFKEKVTALLKSAFDGIIEYLKQIKIRDVLDAIRLSLSAGFLVSFLDFINSFKKAANEFGSIGESISGMFSSIGDAFKNGIEKNLKARSYVLMAIAIGILAAAMVALSKVPEDKLMSVAVTLGLLMAIMTKLAKNLNFFTGSGNRIGDTIKRGVKLNLKVIPDFAATLLSLAVAIGVVAAAVVAFKKNEIHKNDILKVIAVIGALLVMISGFMFVIKRFKLKDVGKSFGLLITVFAILGRVTKMAATVKDIKLRTLGLTFAGITFIMLAMAAILNQASRFKKFKDKTILQLAVMMLAISVAVDIMSNAFLKILAAFSIMQGKVTRKTTFAYAVATMVLLIGSLMGMFWVVSKFNTADIMKGAGAIALMGLAVSIITKPFLKILAAAAAMEGKVNRKASFGGVLLTVVALAGVLVAMAKMTAKIEPGKMMLSAGAMVLFALAINLLTPALTALGAVVVAAIGNVPWDELTNKIGGFGKMLFALAGVAGVVALFGIGMKMLGTGVLRLGTGMLAASGSIVVFSLALLAVAGAIKLLSTSLPQFFQAIFDTIDVIKANGSKMIELVGMVLLGIAGAIVAKKLEVSLAVVELILAIVYVIIQKGPEIFTALEMLLTQLLTWLTGIMGMLASFLVQAVISLINGVANALRANEGALISAFENLIGTVLEIGLKALFTFGDDLIGLLGKFLDMIVKSVFGDNYVSDKILSWIQPDNLRNGLDRINGSIEQAVNEAFRHNDTSSARQAASEQANAYQEELASQMSNSFGAMAGQNKFAEDFAALNPDFKLGAVENIGAYIDGFTSQEPEMSAVSSNIAGSAINAFNEQIPNMESVGSNFLAGLNNGIVDFWNKGTIQQNIGAIGDSMDRTLRKHTGVESPSWMAAEVGTYYIIGLAQGISDNAKLPLQAIEDTTDPMTEALRNAMLQVATVADDDFTIMPRITPVVDMSNVNSAAGLMSGAFGKTYGVAANINAAIRRKANDMEQVASTMEKGRQTVNTGDNITFNIYQQPGEDPDAIADAVMLRMQNRAVRRTAAFG